MGGSLLWTLRLATNPLRPVIARQLKGVVWRNEQGAAPRGPRRGMVGAGGEPLKVVVVGDSTVNGSDIPKRNLALGGQLAEALSARTRRAVSWSVFAAGGVTPSNVLDKYAAKIERERPDLLVVGLGGNCLVQHYSPAGWADALAELIDALRPRVGATPILLTAGPPVWGMKAIPQPLRTYLWLRKLLFDAETKKLARSRPGVFFGPSYLGGSKRYLGPDGCHPSPEGYALWGERIAETVTPLLSDERAVAA
ncbi:MAG TPA: SGNH/GDSL hydrolase family protein [Pyrinomonadaceae bacterium]|nr:SGNH/GDSL hydrolase family protein [Pyrinomonadaceae bacterium]